MRRRGAILMSDREFRFIRPEGGRAWTLVEITLDLAMFIGCPESDEVTHRDPERLVLRRRGVDTVWAMGPRVTPPDQLPEAGRDPTVHDAIAGYDRLRQQVEAIQASCTEEYKALGARLSGIEGDLRRLRGALIDGLDAI
jgi:hypothetical protein